jgi:hypothetical protein
MGKLSSACEKADTSAACTLKNNESHYRVGNSFPNCQWTVANWTLTTLTTPQEKRECPWYTGTTDETGRTGRAGQALANLGYGCQSVGCAGNENTV